MPCFAADDCIARLSVKSIVRVITKVITAISVMFLSVLMFIPFVVLFNIIILPDRNIVVLHKC